VREKPADNRDAVPKKHLVQHLLATAIPPLASQYYFYKVIFQKI
jgi:hypothetical protein